ncbi:hypothetical protein ACFQL7_13560 [Halocatena marina]|uniref:Halobacterial output domain-containing protein n=1 Tax=Halocatena marina TaxID=2934937 RepID=A0ABD5YNB9_9EURY
MIELVNHTCSVRDFELDGTDLETVFDATVEHDRSSDDMTGDATEAVE